MFEINFLNKSGLQYDKKTIKKSNYRQNDNDLNKINQNIIKSIPIYLNYWIVISISVILIFFSIYIIYVNQANYNKSYKNISIPNILNSIYKNSNNFYLNSINTTNNKLYITFSSNKEENIYNNQILFDSLFNIKSFVLSNESGNYLRFDFNWFYEVNDFWDINNLYEQIISANIPNLKFEYFKDKIIIVSNDVEDLVYF